MMKWLFILFMFVAGLYVNLNYGSQQMKEGFSKRCQDVLVQDGDELVLKNTSLAEIPGVNPVRFKNLEDYAEFVEWQHSQNIYCPVQYFQKSYDPQNNPIYQERPQPVDMKDAPPYALAAYPEMDTKNQPNPLLDDYFDVGEKKSVSDNAMDFNWGGSENEQKAIDEGNYKGNEVTRYTESTADY